LIGNWWRRCVTNREGLNLCRFREGHFDKHRLLSRYEANDGCQLALGWPEALAPQSGLLDELAGLRAEGAMVLLMIGEIPDCILNYGLGAIPVIDEIVDLIPGHSLEFRREVRVIVAVEPHLMKGVGPNFLVFFKAPGVVEFEIAQIITVLDIEEKQFESALFTPFEEHVDGFPGNGEGGRNFSPFGHGDIEAGRGWRRFREGGDRDRTNGAHSD